MSPSSPESASPPVRARRTLARIGLCLLIVGVLWQAWALVFLRTGEERWAPPIARVEARWRAGEELNRETRAWGPEPADPQRRKMAEFYAKAYRDLLRPYHVSQWLELIRNGGDLPDRIASGAVIGLGVLLAAVSWRRRRS